MSGGKISIEKKVMKIIAEYSNSNLQQIYSETKLAEDLGLTSFDFVSLCAIFEEKFSMHFETLDDFYDIITVGDLIRIVEGRIKSYA